MTIEAIWKILREHFTTSDFIIKIEGKCIEIQKVNNPREGDVEILMTSTRVHFLGFDSTDLDVLDKIATKIGERWS